MENTLSEGLRGHPDRFFLWKVILNKDIYPNFKLLQIGIGQADRNGFAMKDAAHFVCENEIVSWKKTLSDTSNSMRYVERDGKPPCSLMMAIWTDIPTIQFMHGNYKRINGFREVSRELYPIGAVSTEFGAINLVRTSRMPSLKRIAAYNITKKIDKLGDLDQLVLPSPIKLLLKRTWIRQHAILVTNPIDWCVCKERKVRISPRQ